MALCLIPFLPAFHSQPLTISLTFSPPHSFLIPYFPCILSSPCPPAPYTLLFLPYLLTFFFLSGFPSFAFLLSLSSPLLPLPSYSSFPSSLFPFILLSPPPSPSPISYPPPSSPLSLFSPFLISPSVAYFYSGVKFVYAENLPTYKSVRRSFNKLMSLLENKE